MKPKFSTGIACAMLGGAFVLAGPARAALGESAISVSHDVASLRAVAHAAVVQAAYTVHEITLASGTVVREYVAPNGIVFGVAWEGPTLPDLRATLGAAFGPYVAANATRRATPLAVSNSDLVVYSGGHLRAFAGHAWLPKAVPPGIDVGVIQ